ncbi:isocitrate lyase/phosphoenolpyruvate mutase family protein [Xenorhabdus sp. ZM]|uniref:isocitrate lyase/phosphoenolpyruvate mutase family protein n=1 Tax=Xenorhabdus szentirmaii TaxID=290112 RepID=UPI0019877C05|nr:isocitrate lyase/phosphoenolpyruvate mutase family protein [Xenorhabdus sp. ZM]
MLIFYLSTGADCIFIPGLADLNVCKVISSQINGSLNIMVLSNTSNAEAFFAAGVNRISGSVFLLSKPMGLPHLG